MRGRGAARSCFSYTFYSKYYTVSTTMYTVLERIVKQCVKFTRRRRAWLWCGLVLRIAQKEGGKTSREIHERGVECRMALVKEIIIQRGAPPDADDLDHAVHEMRTGSAEAKTLAANILANSAINARAKEAIAAVGAIPVLVALLSSGPAPAVEAAARALGNLASTSEANRQAIGQAGGISPLVALLMHGTTSQRCASATAMMHLALHPANKLAAREAGVVLSLQRMASTGTQGEIDRAARALRILEARDECVVSAGLARPPVAGLAGTDLTVSGVKGSAVSPPLRQRQLGAGEGGQRQVEVLGGDSPDSVLFSPTLPG